MVKFICKDFWTLLFKKPVSGLRTNTGPNPKVSLCCSSSGYNILPIALNSWR